MHAAATPHNLLARLFSGALHALTSASGRRLALGQRVQAEHLRKGLEAPGALGCISKVNKKKKKETGCNAEGTAGTPRNRR